MNSLFDLSTLWHDPVWSAVIAGLVVAAIAAMSSPVRRLVAEIAHKLLNFARVSGFVQVEVDETLQHVPLLSVTVRNRTCRSIHLTSLEFTTENSWAIPDPRRRGYAVSVLPFIPKGIPCAIIPAVQQGVASLPLTVRCRARSVEIVNVRLVTDSCPSYGLGVFPFHLRVVLKWNGGKKQFRLPDILISLHGSTVLSESTMSPPTILPKERAEIRRCANEALATIHNGAVCSPQVRVALESVTSGRVA